MSDQHARPEPGDQGFTLIDIIVATSIMAVIMVIVTGGILEVYSDVNKTDGISTARDQVGNSFRRLDKELRYATWVATPGQVNGAWYLEWATPVNCQQLVFQNGVLTKLVWTLPGVTPGSPQTIASDLAQTGTTPPFTVYLPGNKPYASASPGRVTVPVAIPCIAAASPASSPGSNSRPVRPSRTNSGMPPIRLASTPSP